MNKEKVDKPVKEERNQGHNEVHNSEVRTPNDGRFHNVTAIIQKPAPKEPPKDE